MMARGTAWQNHLRSLLFKISVTTTAQPLCPQKSPSASLSPSMHCDFKHSLSSVMRTVAFGAQRLGATLQTATLASRSTSSSGNTARPRWLSP
eukprot:m.59434 g.59434  ORF g.59434 m.59434 type:complete len:93 (-) comp9464_c0_seq2:810-1088(-)